ncbi:MAG: ABC transporter permease [Pseudomonadota bacterium]
MRGYRRYLGVVWIGTILTLLYVPIVSVVLVSLANTRYMRFPHRVWTTDAYGDAIDSFTIWSLHLVSLQIALCVVFLAVLLGTLGAMAFACYDWKGRSLFQRLIMLPIFFPQPVLGLALLLAFSALGITPGWKTAVIAHAVWIVPIVTLVISIRLFGYDAAQEEAAFDLGASRWQVAREITIPALWPGIFSGALFAFLLSWSNLPLSVFTSGADTPLPVWLFSRTATNYSPLVPAVAVIGTLASAMGVILLFALRWIVGRLRGGRSAP